MSKVHDGKKKQKRALISQNYGNENSNLFQRSVGVDAACFLESVNCALKHNHKTGNRKQNGLFMNANLIGDEGVTERTAESMRPLLT